MTATFIGIDLAWKTARNPSGAAVLQGDRQGVRLEELATLGSDASVAEFIKKHATDDTVVAIDGPLVIVNETGQRPCEIEVSKRYSARDAGCYPSNLQLLPNASSVALARELETQGFTHVDRSSDEHHGRIMAEVYPHAGMVALWDLRKTIKYKRGVAAVKRAGLQDFRTRLASLYDAEPPLLRTGMLKELLNLNLDESGGTRLKDHEDRLDALFCAYLAYYFWYWGWERNELFGDIETGYILNPILHKTGSGTGVPPVSVAAAHAQDAHATTAAHAQDAHATTAAHAQDAHATTAAHAQDAHATTAAHAQDAHATTAAHAQDAHATSAAHAQDAHATTAAHAQDAHATSAARAQDAHATSAALAQDAHGTPAAHAQDAHAALETLNLKPETDFPSLISQAHALARPIKTSDDCQAGDVASVIVSRSGKIFTGVCLDFSSSLGFCAEHAAIAEMLKAHESEIAMVVAVGQDGTVMPPCGRCREMMWQLNPVNRDALVILAHDRSRPLDELLPER